MMTTYNKTPLPTHPLPIPTNHSPFSLQTSCRGVAPCRGTAAVLMTSPFKDENLVVECFSQPDIFAPRKYSTVLASNDEGNVDE